MPYEEQDDEPNIEIYSLTCRDQRTIYNHRLHKKEKNKKFNITSYPFPLNFSSLNKLHNSLIPFGPINLE